MDSMNNTTSYVTMDTLPHSLLIAPYMYAGIIIVPFILLRNLMFSNKPVGEIGVVFRVHKSELNPFCASKCNISLRIIGSENTTKVKGREAVAQYIKYLIEEDVKVYMFTYDINHQIVAMKDILGSVAENVNFIDIGTMFLQKYKDIPSVTFNDIVDMMDLNRRACRVHKMEDMVKTLVGSRRYGDVHKISGR